MNMTKKALVLLSFCLVSFAGISGMDPNLEGLTASLEEELKDLKDVKPAQLVQGLRYKYFGRYYQYDGYDATKKEYKFTREIDGQKLVGAYQISNWMPWTFK